MLKSVQEVKKLSKYAVANGGDKVYVAEVSQ